MKRKQFILLTLLPFIGLASCKGTIFTYGNKVDLSKEYILYGIKDQPDYITSMDDSEGDYAESKGYNIPLRYADADEIINAVDNGEDILLLFLSDSCASCKETLPSVFDNIKHLNLNIYCIKENNGENASKLNQYIAENGIKKVSTEVMNGGTPSMYLLNKKQLTEVFYGPKGSQTTNAVINALKEYTSCCGLIYNAYNYQYLRSDVITYTLDKNDKGSTYFFYNELLPLAKKSKKAIQILDATKHDREYVEYCCEEIKDIVHNPSANEWGADNFGGWFVPAYPEATENGVDNTLFKHYDDPGIKTWLAGYFAD